MSDYAWAIKSKDKSFDLDTYDYWNNEDGWTEYLSCASLYSDEEKEALLIWNSPRQLDADVISLRIQHLMFPCLCVHVHSQQIDWYTHQPDQYSYLYQ